MNDLKNVKVGDKVWTELKIIEIDTREGIIFPIIAELPNGQTRSFTKDGKQYPNDEVASITTTNPFEENKGYWAMVSNSPIDEKNKGYKGSKRFV